MRSWTFSLEGCVGYPLDSIIIPRVPERPQNSEQMRRNFKSRASKNLINELRASKRIVEASKTEPQKNIINELKASKRIVEASRAGPQKPHQ